MKLLENYSLLAYNTFGIDVSTRYFFEYQSSDELIEFLKSNFLNDKSFFSLGGECIVYQAVRRRYSSFKNCGI